MDIQVSSMDDAWAQDKVNAAFSSLYNQMTTYEKDTTDQEFAVFEYCGPVTERYTCKVDKPLTEVPLVGVTVDSNEQLNVGYIDVNGEVHWCQSINGIRPVTGTNILQWQTNSIDVVVAGENIRTGTYRIGGNGPELSCACRAKPCVWEFLCCEELECVPYCYDYCYHYCGYCFCYNDGSQASDVVGWYDNGTSIVYVHTSDFNGDCLSTSCKVRTLTTNETCIECGVTWEIVNKICCWCVYETWLRVPRLNCEIYSECGGCYLNTNGYLRPAFWCYPGNQKQFSATATSFSFNYLQCSGREFFRTKNECLYVTFIGAVPGFKYCINMGAVNDGAWNPNSDYMESSLLNKTTWNPSSNNSYNADLLKNYVAVSDYAEHIDSGIHAIPYDKSVYAELKENFDASTTHKRSVGWISDCVVETLLCFNWWIQRGCRPLPSAEWKETPFSLWYCYGYVTNERVTPPCDCWNWPYTDVQYDFNVVPMLNQSAYVTNPTDGDIHLTGNSGSNSMADPYSIGTFYCQGEDHKCITTTPGTSWSWLYGMGDRPTWARVWWADRNCRQFNTLAFCRLTKQYWVEQFCTAYVNCVYGDFYVYAKYRKARG